MQWVKKCPKRRFHHPGERCHCTLPVYSLQKDNSVSSLTFLPKKSKSCISTLGGLRPKRDNFQSLNGPTSAGKERESLRKHIWCSQKDCNTLGDARNVKKKIPVTSSWFWMMSGKGGVKMKCGSRYLQVLASRNSRVQLSRANADKCFS